MAAAEPWWRGQARNGPLRAMPPFERLTKGQSYAPRVEIIVGRDGYSGGISILAYLVNEAGGPAMVPLFCHRWVDAPQSLEECLQVAYRGLSAYFEEAGIAAP